IYKIRQTILPKGGFALISGSKPSDLYHSKQDQLTCSRTDRTQSKAAGVTKCPQFQFFLAGNSATEYVIMQSRSRRFLQRPNLSTPPGTTQPVLWRPEAAVTGSSAITRAGRREKKAMKTRSILAALAALLLGAASSFAQNWDRGVSLFNQKQYREAIREFHGVLRSNPGYWQAWYFIGFGHFQLKEYEDAVDSFQSYIKGAAGH